MRFRVALLLPWLLVETSFVCAGPPGPPAVAVRYTKPNDQEVWIHLELTGLAPSENFVQHVPELVDGPGAKARILGDVLGMGRWLQAGKPELPVYNARIRIPRGKALAGIEAAAQPEETEVWRDITVAPAPDTGWAEYPGVPRPARKPDAAVYGADAYFPDEHASLGKTTIVRGSQGTSINIFPFRYHPRQNTLEVSRKLLVKVKLKPAEALDEAPAVAYADRFGKAYADQVSQYELPEMPDPLPEVDGCQYLVFTPDDRIGALEPLLAEKRARGMKVRVVRLSELATGDAPLSADQRRERILARIAQEYLKQPTPVYLLLVGDAEDIPPFYRTQHPSPLYEQSLLIATDLYYGTLTGGADDLTPELYIGRLPARNSAELTVMVDKILRYMRTLPASWTPRNWGNVLVAGEYQNTSYLKQGEQQHVCVDERWFLQTANDVSQFLQDRGYGVTTAFCANNTAILDLDRYFYDAVTPLPTNLEFLSDRDAVARLIDRWNQRTRLIVHRDHGLDSGWVKPGFSVAHIEDLSPPSGDSFHPIVFSLNCETGFFDHPYRQCFAEQLLRSPKGATAVIAATRISYSRHNDRFAEGLMASVWPEFELTFDPNAPRLDLPNEPGLGAVLQSGRARIERYYPVESGPITKVELELFHLFGDPEMQLLGQNLFVVGP